jgi:hypothetical protein
MSDVRRSRVGRLGLGGEVRLTRVERLKRDELLEVALFHCQQRKHPSRLSALQFSAPSGVRFVLEIGS